MAIEGGSDGFIGGAASLLASPALRNASLACLAVTSVFLSLKAIKNDAIKPPKVPDKDEKYRNGRSVKSASSTSSISLKEKSTNSHDGPIIRNTIGTNRNGLGDSFQNEDQSRSNSTSSMVTQTDLNVVRTGVNGMSSGISKNSIAIFWDVDNCSPHSGASGHEVAQAIRLAAQSAGPETKKIGMITSFKAYLELSSESSAPNATQVQFRSELQGSGVSLIDTPKSGRKDVADKMMIADLLSYAIDRRPPALIVLLSGDRDFAYPLGILRNRGYDILLITPPIGASPILEASATYKLRWRQDVLGIDYDANGRPYNSTSALLGEGAQDSGKKLNGTAGSVTASIKPQDTANNTPPVFQPLVTVLEKMHQEGHARPLRSLTSMRLRLMDPKVFEKAQASGWNEYTQIAAAAGIVTLGPGTQTGFEWIALRNNEGSQTVSRPVLLESAVVNASPIEIDEEGIKIFYPLIEAYKSLKAGMPATKDPSARSVADALDEIAERGQFNPYKASGAKTWDHYIKMAFKAKVARLAPGDNGPVVQMHPRYAAMHTGLVMPSNPNARMIDTTNISAPEMKQNRFASLFSSKNKDDKKVADEEIGKLHVNHASTNGPSSSVTIRAYEPFKPFPRSFAHQPSGETINIAFFPLVNFLLTKRSEGEFATPENHVHMSVSKHHKLGKSIQSWRQFQGYIYMAVEEDIITLLESREHEYKFVQLHERLTKGEGEGKHKGFQKGHNTQPKRSDDQRGSPIQENVQSDRWKGKESSSRGSSSPQSSSSELSKNYEQSNGHVRPIVIKPVDKPSEQFNTVASTPSDRQKFKLLIEVIVAIRKRAIIQAKNALSNDKEDIILSGLEPSRVSVATMIMEEDNKNHPDSQTYTPAAWLQSHGFNSFSEFFIEAEKKGFVHLITREASQKVRLAQRYEEIFFPDNVVKV